MRESLKKIFVATAIVLGCSGYAAALENVVQVRDVNNIFFDKDAFSGVGTDSDPVALTGQTTNFSLTSGASDCYVVDSADQTLSVNCLDNRS